MSGNKKQPVPVFQPVPPAIYRPSDESVFRTSGLTAEERSELNQARAWFNLRQPPTLTQGQIANGRLTNEQAAAQNALLRADWQRHRQDLGMSPAPPYQGSDTAIVGILVLPDGTRIPIQSRNDPGPATRAILGSQTVVDVNGRPTLVTQTWGAPKGPGNGVTGNIVHIEPWAAAILNKTGETNAVLLIELPNCDMCSNMHDMLPPNSRITVVSPEEAVTFFSAHGGRWSTYQQRRIDYVSPQSREAIRQALYRSRLRGSSGGFIDLGRPFSIGRSRTSALSPSRLAGLRAGAPTAAGYGAGIAGGIAIGYILASLNSAELQKKYGEAQPLVHRDIASQSDKVMSLMAAGKRPYAVMQFQETYQDLHMGPGAGWSPTVSSYQYVKTTIEEQPRDETTPGKREYGIGSITHFSTVRISNELKAPADLVDAYRELREGLSWLETAVEDPFLSPDETLLLSQHKMRLEGWSQQLFGPPLSLPPVPPQPAGGIPRPASPPGSTGNTAQDPSGGNGSGAGAAGARAVQPGGGGPTSLSRDAIRVLSLLPQYRPGVPGMTNREIIVAYQQRYKDYLPSADGPLQELNRAGKVKIEKPLDIGNGVKVEDFSRGPTAAQTQQRAWKL
jgi:hypothetical protein